jgi:SAM-dependent methyltransferase
METSGEAARRQAWSAYWREGALHSCAGSYARNYDGVVGDFWDACFNTAHASSRILDLGTGNGALPLRLWERFGGEAAMCIDAVDLASIRPAWHDPAVHAGIRFHSGVSMEALPFRDAAFDLALGQYSLEYARWPDSVQECLRVLAADGGMAFVLHHAESVLVRVAREEVRHIELLCAEGGLIAAARAVLPWLARGSRR